MSALFLRLASSLLLALSLLAPAWAAEPLSPAQKEEVEKIMHDYFMAHPEFMVEVLHAAEAKLKAEKAEESKVQIAAKQDELFHDETAPIGGNPNGDVTIVEFFDYRCPYCKQVEPSLEALIKEDPKLRIVYKEFPVLGPASIYASRMALAARMQGKYAAFHDAMMAAKGQIAQETILKVAKSVGLDMDKAKTDMRAPEIEEQLKRNYSLAQDLDIQGTPAFVVGDKLIPGATDIDNLKKLVAAARKAS
jgi:protein-disulfide isomerase